MALTKKQIKKLIELIATCESDPLDCDHCFERVAEFAEVQLAGRDVPEALREVQRHLEQCPCCGDELRALMEGLREIDRNDDVSS